MSDASARPTVVVVGAGFGGLRAVRAFRRVPVDVVLLDRHKDSTSPPGACSRATAPCRTTT